MMKIYTRIVFFACVFATLSISKASPRDDIVKNLADLYSTRYDGKHDPQVQQCAEYEVQALLKNMKPRFGEIRRNQLQDTVVLVPSAVQYRSDDVPAAFKECLLQPILTRWINIKSGLKVKNFGVTWTVFNTTSSNSSKPDWYQFLIAFTTDDKNALMAKAHEAFQLRALEYHNELRNRHTPLNAEPFPLQLADESYTLYGSSAKYAKEFETGEPGSSVSQGRYSENLCSFYGSFAVPFAETAAELACDGWYNAIQQYNFDDPATAYHRNALTFTALIWKESKILDMGVHYCTKTILNKDKPVIVNYVEVVARYEKAGNVILENTADPYALFRINVLKPTTTKH